MRVGFIGLGRMGRAMALNLAAFHPDLLVHDVNPDALEPLLAAGAQRAGSVAELAARCDVIFTSLPGPVEVETVLLGEGGILPNAREGLCLFDLSTSSHALACRLAADFAKAGACMLDAPVSGGPAGAASRDLVIWVGGEKARFDEHLELLRAIGRQPLHVGATGAGTVIKLAHNMLGYAIMLAEAEVFSMATKAGVDPLDLWQALRLGVVGKQSPLDMLTRQFLPGIYDQPAFALRLARKDVVLATEMARDLNVPMPMAALTLAEMTEAVARGMGEQDSRAYLQLQLERAGVEIRVDGERIAAALASAVR